MMYMSWVLPHLDAISPSVARCDPGVEWSRNSLILESGLWSWEYNSWERLGSLDLRNEGAGYSKRYWYVGATRVFATYM